MPRRDAFKRNGEIRNPAVRTMAYCLYRCGRVSRMLKRNGNMLSSSERRT